ncbi:MAG: hypothetical protein AVO39_06105 [delta proteobacterium MLS_D]|jgi:DNA repair protein RecO (recombination protein O)|nr:MAG: hypothetical protein AVO39_06105 [delta proteobacterium MLS_D]
MTEEERKQRALGCVLACRDYGEADRIVTFFTAERGKLKGIAKSARKSAKRFSNAIELFSLSQIIFSRRRAGTLYLIEDCHVVNHYSRIREDLEKTLAASYFIELIDLFSLEEKPAAHLFDHLKTFLDLLEDGPFSASLVRLFELRLLNLCGYEPALERCARCGVPLDTGEKIMFCAEDGGISCSRCRRDTAVGIRVSAGTVKTLITGKHLPPDKLRRLVFSGQALRESEEILTRFIVHVLGKQPRSLHVFREVLLLGNRR